MINKEKIIILAAGRIKCARCQATSKRTKLQCGRPAIKGKSVCDFHGGRSTGPKTDGGRQRSRQAHIKSGNYTQESRLHVKSTLLKLAYLQDMMHMVEMTNADRTRGPKPTGYVRLTSLHEIVHAIEQNQRALSSVPPRTEKNNI